MPRSITFYTLISLFLVSCGSQKVDDNSTAEQLARTIFSAIKHDQPETILKYIEGQGQIDWRKANWERFDAKYSQRRLDNYGDTYLQRIKEVRQKFLERGFKDWESAEFDRLTFEAADNNGHLMQRYNEIYFKTKDGDNGSIKVTLFFQTDSGWYAGKWPEIGRFKSSN